MKGKKSIPESMAEARIMIMNRRKASLIKDTCVKSKVPEFEKPTV